MYYPYLRGKQFEYIAIRELLEDDKLYSNVTPVIEPVSITASMNKTIRMFAKENRNLILIQNPKVGNFLEDLEIEKKDGNKYALEFEKITNNEYIKKAYIIDEEKDYTELHDDYQHIIINKADIIYYFNTEQLKEHIYFVPDDRVFRKKFKAEKKILLEDNFVKKDRNADYEEKDEFFSRDHLDIIDAGKGANEYLGFADYSIIGKGYSETGFAPRAVAIHIVYFDNNYELRISHFVSDDNFSRKDPANKYRQAVIKLEKWYKSNDDEFKNRNKSIGLKHFLSDAKSGAYPGLGVIKKLSIMHHLEIVGRFLEKV